jgi:hypothetical protein
VKETEGIMMFRKSQFMVRSAVAAALALGAVGATVAAPAVAKEAPKPANSPEFSKVAAPLQKDVNALLALRGKASAEQLKAAALPLVPRVAALDSALKTPMDLLIAGDWQRQVGTFAGDDALAMKGLDHMIASGQLEPATLGQVQAMRGQYAYIAKDYPKAIELLGPVATSGTADEMSVRMVVDAYGRQNQAAQGLNVLQKAIAAQQAAGKPVPESWYTTGLGMAFNAKAMDAAGKFSNGLVASYPSSRNWAGAISVVRMVGQYQPQESLDLFRLMDRTNSFNEANEYLDYVTAADARRAPGEVLKIIGKGTAAGTIKATDSYVVESRNLANSRLAADKASLPAAATAARAPNAAVATVMGTADAFLSYDQPAEAEALYTIALTKPGVDAGRALTRLGIAQVDQGKAAEAQATFAKVTGPRKPIADLWSIYAAQKAKGG